MENWEFRPIPTGLHRRTAAIDSFIHSFIHSYPGLHLIRPSWNPVSPIITLISPHALQQSWRILYEQNRAKIPYFLDQVIIITPFNSLETQRHRANKPYDAIYKRDSKLSPSQSWLNRIVPKKNWSAPFFINTQHKGEFPAHQSVSHQTVPPKKEVKSSLRILWSLIQRKIWCSL